jgi:formate hydrogenlyase subunit 4
VTFAAGLLTAALHAALMLLAAPTLAGVVASAKARLTGRRGPPLLQPWRDLRRLLRKQRLWPEHSGMVFRLAPALGLACIAAAALLVPSFARGMATAPLADLLVIAGLMAAARALRVLAALDSGTAFAGLGAQREMAFAVLAEPALLISIAVVALIAGTTNLDGMMGTLAEGNVGLRVSLALLGIALAAVALAEAARMPVDNPATHLELTMVHEATALEYSGADLALVHAQAWLHLLVWIALLGGIFLPFGIAPPGAGPLSWLLGMGLFALKALLLALALAVFEVTIAKMRVFRVTEFLGAALLMALMAALLLFISTGIA